jgi:hypothetical protein
MWQKEPKRSETSAQREAGRAFRPAETKQTTNDYLREQQAIHKNRERLKAERLAREADAAATPPRKPGP